MKTIKQPKPTAKNHKVGDTAIIRNAHYGHRFTIGTKVRIESVGENDYRAVSLNGADKWWVADANFMTKKQLEVENEN